MKQNIILIGFMGAGKTTVGAALAEKLQYRLVDTDAVIEEKEGRTIQSIFSEEGEEYFRNLETKALEELLQKGAEQTVLATGGGLPLRQCNGILLQKMGLVVFLKAEKETVLKRLEKDEKRPLLQGAGPEERVAELLEFRDPIYEYTAHIVIPTDGKAVDEITEEIIRNYKIMTGDRKGIVVQA